MSNETDEYIRNELIRQSSGEKKEADIIWQTITLLSTDSKFKEIIFNLNEKFFENKQNQDYLELKNSIIKSENASLLINSTSYLIGDGTNFMNIMSKITCKIYDSMFRPKTHYESLKSYPHAPPFSKHCERYDNSLYGLLPYLPQSTLPLPEMGTHDENRRNATLWHYQEVTPVEYRGILVGGEHRLLPYLPPHTATHVDSSRKRRDSDHNYTIQDGISENPDPESFAFHEKNRTALREKRFVSGV